jgi:hypothetical protein
LAAALTLALLAFAGEAGAVTKTWNCVSGNWFSQSCFSPAGAPTSADQLTVGMVGNQSSTLTIDNFTSFVMGSNPVAQMLSIDSGSPVGYPTVVQTGGTLTVSNDWVGYNGNGFYNLAGGNFLTAYETIGVKPHSIGDFNQSGGNHTASVSLRLGDFASSYGYYNLSAGTVNTGALFVGYEGQGQFNQTGGSVTAASLGFGLLSGGSGNVYTLSGGTVNISGAITTGPSGGAFSLDGGTLTVGSGNIALSTLSLGSVAGAAGSYTQSGGTVSVGNLVLGTAGSSAAYTLAGGTLNIGTTLSAGGNSVLNLNGGSFAALSDASLVDLVLGSTEGSAFTLNIGGGGGANTFTTLSAATETIGGLGAGRVVQTGGSNTVGTLTINDRYTYNGGSLVVTGSLANNGALELGGTSLAYGTSAVNNGLVSGYGRLSGSGDFTNNGLVSQAGGNLTLAGTGTYTNNANWDLQGGRQLKLEGAGFINAGSLNLNGGLVTGTGSLTNMLGGTIAGNGTISAPFSNAGTLALTAGTTTVSLGFVNTGVIQLSSNAASLNGGAIDNSGLIQGLGKIVNTVNNSGTIQASGGTLTLTQALNNSGTLVADKASTLLFQTGLLASSGAIHINGGTLNNSGHTLNNSGQILVSTGAGQLNGGLSGLAGSQLVVSGGGSLTLYDTVDIQSGAELRVASGASATFFGQVLQRTGSVFIGTGMKFYEGGLSVGASPGLGTDTGSVTFGTNNVYLAEIGGVTACTLACAGDADLKNSSFDKYTISGNLQLGGTLQLKSWNGFVAQAGQSFDLLDWGSVSGGFGAIDTSGLQLADGTALDLSRLYTLGEIAVVAVPEPSSLALWAAGLAGMLYWRQRALDRHPVGVAR